MTTPTTPQTLGQLIQSKAERFPDTAVLRFVQVGRPDEVVTYGTLATKAQKLAVTLRHRGLTRGTTFAVMMRNHPEFVYALVAASLLGAVCVPVDPRARGEALRAQLAHAECRGLLVADYALPQVLPILSQLPGMRVVYVLHTSAEGAAEESYGSGEC